MLSFLVLSFLVAGWIWHRNGVVTRHEELRESVEKYGGKTYFDQGGVEIECWLMKLKLGKRAHTLFGGIVIFGKEVDIRAFLTDPFAVEISGSPAIDDEDLKTIASFGTINGLELPVSTLGDPQAEILGRCRNLEYLDLTGVSLSDDGFAHLGNLTGLRGGTFSNSVLSDHSCEVLLKMKRLSHLEIRRTSFTVEGLRLIAEKHRSLREIIITEGVLRKDELEKFAELNSELEITLTPAGDPFKSLGLETIFR